MEGGIDGGAALYCYRPTFDANLEHWTYQGKHHFMQLPAKQTEKPLASRLPFDCLSAIVWGNLADKMMTEND